MKNIKVIPKLPDPPPDIESIKYLLHHNTPQTAFNLTVVSKSKLTEQEFVDWLQDFVDYYNDNEGDIFDSSSKMITEVQ